MFIAHDLIVLIVEDDDFQRRALAKMLRGLGVPRIVEAANGRQALAMMRSAARIDLVVCDLDMPEMDGIEFMRHMGQIASSAALIINSSKEQSLLDSVAKMAQSHGLHLLGVIAKPTTQSKLEDLLANYKPRQLSAAALVTKPTFRLAEILAGITQKQFLPFFQPKIDFQSGRLLGAEVLARWNHPEHGLIYPTAFIKLLEHNNEIDGLTMLMLKEAAIACRQWREQGMDLTVAVNLSLVSLGDTHLADRVTQVVRAAGLDPQYMILEITETAIMADMSAALENLTRLRMRGFGLAIDDYGTGFSSLQRLGQIPFTELKIDQSFVTDCGDHPASRVMVESSIALAHRLNIKCVAEGVESQADWDGLKAMQCDVAQGYLIAKPMDAWLFLEHWASRHEGHAH